MSAYTNLIANIDKTAYTTVWDMDKIIGTLSGTLSIIAPTNVSGPRTSTTTIGTTFGDTYYFQGVFSTDNGVTWNDFGAMTPNLTTPGSPVFQTMDVNANVGSAGSLNIFLTNYYDFVHGVGTAYTILYKVILYAKNAQGAITPMAIAPSTIFTSRARNYQKIAIKDQVPFNFTSGNGNTVTVSHNLGFVPKIRAFYHQSSPFDRMDTLWWAYFIDTHVTSTDVTFLLEATHNTLTRTGNIEYRLYYDQ